ncbi:hypothetical protein ACVXHB_10690 [Escherichia coli]
MTILIVGETSRAENFFLNGYRRETNPRLVKITWSISLIQPSSRTRQRQFQYRACSRICRVSTTKKSWHSAEGVLDIISERASNVLWNDQTMAAVKVPATACLARTSPR